MTEIDITRTNPGVDPTLHIWGWEIPVYLFLGGVTAGVMILTSLLALRGPGARSTWARRLPLAAPVLLSLGMLALFLDLAHKLHVYRFYLVLRPTSPMSWGAWILVAIYPITALLGLALLEERDVEQLGRVPGLGPIVRWARHLAAARIATLARLTIAAGIALGVYTGVLLGTLAARAAWSSPLLGPLFLVSGFSTGAAFLLLFPLSDEEAGLVRRLDVLAIVVELALLALFLVGLRTASAAGAGAAALFLGGRFTAPFWALVVGAGLVVPLVLAAVEHRRHLVATRVAPVLVLAGGLALRWVLVAAGQG